MAWTAPITFVGQARLTAAQLNEQLRDNMLETMPGKATTPGSYFVTTADNTITERLWDTQFIDNPITTTSTTYNSVSNAGPSLTVNTTARALVLLSCNMESSGSNISTFMGVAISGATTLAAEDSRAVAQRSNSSSTMERQYMRVVAYTGLNPGSNTFTAMYRTTSGTGNFQRRRLTVLPF